MERRCRGSVVERADGCDHLNGVDLKGCVGCETSGAVGAHIKSDIERPHSVAPVIQVVEAHVALAGESAVLGAEAHVGSEATFDWRSERRYCQPVLYLDILELHYEILLRR